MGQYNVVNPPNAPNYAAPLVGMQIGQQLANIPNSYFAGTQQQNILQQQAPIIDPRTGQPVDPNDPSTFDIIQKEIIKRGGVQGAESVMPYLWKTNYLRSGGGGLPPVDPDLVSAAQPGAPGTPPANVAAANKQPNKPGVNDPYYEGGAPTLASIATEMAGGRDVSPIISGVATRMNIDPADELSPRRAAIAKGLLSQAITGGTGRLPPSPVATAGGPSEGETSRGPAATSAEESSQPPGTMPVRMAAAGAPAPVTNSPGTNMPASGIMPGGGPMPGTPGGALAFSGAQPQPQPQTAFQPPNTTRPPFMGNVQQPQPRPQPVPPAQQQAVPGGGGYLPPGGVGGMAPSATVVPPKFQNDVPAFIAKLRAQADRDAAAAARGKVVGFENKPLEERAANFRSRADKLEESLIGSAAKRDEAQVGRYKGLYAGLQDQGNVAASSQDEIERSIGVLNMPGIATGWGQGAINGAKQFLAATGLDPNAALGADAFKKTMGEFLLKQTAGLRDQAIEAGGNAGRIFAAQIDTMIQANPSPANSLPGNRYLIEVYRRAADRQIELADMAARYKGGNLDAGFEIQMRKYQQEHPLFTRDELSHPEMIAAPTYQSRAAIDAAIVNGDLVKNAPVKVPCSRKGGGGGYQITHAGYWQP
jgi:hypothetical protein